MRCESATNTKNTKTPFCLDKEEPLFAHVTILISSPHMRLVSAPGFLLLKESFFLPLLLVGGQALGFWKAMKHNFDHNRHHINKAEFNFCILLRQSEYRVR